MNLFVQPAGCRLLAAGIFVPIALVILTPVAAQTLNVLHTFMWGKEGTRPASPLVQATDGRLYGTTYVGGGADQGTAFGMNADGTGFTVLKHFSLVGTGTADGYRPNAGLLQGNDGRLYGTTYNGGLNWGTVFALNTDGSGFTVVHSFNGTNGSAPSGELMQGSDGRLYGTTSVGGTGTRGLVFALHTNGTGFVVLRHLNSGVDGGNPLGKLIEGSDGMLYGTTSEYGANGNGTVFALNKDGTGFTVLHQFVAATDGDSPRAGLYEGSDGRLYGTTYQAGTNNYGTIFALQKNGLNFTVLRHFGSVAGDGLRSRSQLVAGSDGRLYGTTEWGNGSSAGAVFAIGQNGTGYATLRTFTGGLDGGRSGPGLAKGIDGRLYGVTGTGGSNDANGYGTLFAIAENGTGFTVLRYIDPESEGIQPQGRPLLGSDGRIYGAARQGGNGGNTSHKGTIFAVNRNGSGFTVLHDFPYQSGGFVGGGGWNPDADLIEGIDGRLYGTTDSGGGISGRGTVFALNRDGTSFVLLHSFQASEGYTPRGSLVQASDGRLYGTTNTGGTFSAGSIFGIGTNGSNFTVLRHFNRTTDGGEPEAGLVEGSDGRLYGTTRTNGVNGYGTLFAITKDGTSFTVLRHLNGTSDGGTSYYELMRGSDGRLYGTTTGGSTGGTAYGVNIDGSGFAVLRAFPATLGSTYPPAGSLVEGGDGRLYGATSLGGGLGGGVIYSVAKDGSGYVVVRDLNPSLDGHGRVAFTRDTDGTLYGLAESGGTFEQGTIVSLNPVHSTDSDRNSRISLLELTRVIELYNTRNGTTRTGGYNVNPTTEDGFAPDPTRASGAVVTLPFYHSADANLDGKLNLLELTRVIELYNYRSGTTRTGQYHIQAGTEDGFAPGP